MIESSILHKILKNGFSMPVYGLGTWGIGGFFEREDSCDEQTEAQSIENALKQGITHIDSAEIYAGGYTECLVGKAIVSFSREKLFLVSKVGGDNLSYEHIFESCMQSLKGLNTTYLDMLLLHRYNPVFSLKDSIRALEDLKSMGFIRAIGVSNFGVEHLQEAQSYTKYPIVCNQVHYNLEFREPECSGLLDFCQKNDIMIVAYRSVQKGVFSKSTPKILLDMAQKYKKTPMQVALNWLISQENVVAIAKTSTSVQVTENLGALGWKMSVGDIERLRNEYPEQKKISAVPLG